MTDHHVTYELLVNVAWTWERVRQGFTGELPDVDRAEFVFTYRGTIPDRGESSHTMCEAIWMRHQQDDRPDGRLGPSLSTGDIIRLIWSTGPRAGQVEHWAVVTVGLEPTGPPAREERRKLWIEVMHENPVVRERLLND